MSILSYKDVQEAWERVREYAQDCAYYEDDADLFRANQRLDFLIITSALEQREELLSRPRGIGDGDIVAVLEERDKLREKNAWLIEQLNRDNLAFAQVSENNKETVRLRFKHNKLVAAANDFVYKTLASMPTQSSFDTLRELLQEFKQDGYPFPVPERKERS